MRFLADESCDFAVVRALRSEDHDVLAIAEVSPREEDQDVMERAVREGRLLITDTPGIFFSTYAAVTQNSGDSLRDCATIAECLVRYCDNRHIIHSR